MCRGFEVTVKTLVFIVSEIENLWEPLGRLNKDYTTKVFSRIFLASVLRMDCGTEVREQRDWGGELEEMAKICARNDGGLTIVGVMQTVRSS